MSTSDLLLEFFPLEIVEAYHNEKAHRCFPYTVGVTVTDTGTGFRYDMTIYEEINGINIRMAYRTVHK